MRRDGEGQVGEFLRHVRDDNTAFFSVGEPIRQGHTLEGLVYA